MIGSTEACHETLQCVTKFQYCCGVGERAVLRFVGFEQTLLISHVILGYVDMLYESEFPTPNSFCWRSFFVRTIWVTQNVSKLNPVADTRLYRDPYCNGICENRCIFWWFFESVGPHKRSQTLHVIISDNKYICNIKIKIKIFST